MDCRSVAIRNNNEYYIVNAKSFDEMPFSNENIEYHFIGNLKPLNSFVSKVIVNHSTKKSIAYLDDNSNQHVEYTHVDVFTIKVGISNTADFNESNICVMDTSCVYDSGMPKR